MFIFRMVFAVHILAYPNVWTAAIVMEISPAQSTAASWSSGSKELSDVGPYTVSVFFEVFSIGCTYCLHVSSL